VSDTNINRNFWGTNEGTWAMIIGVPLGIAFLFGFIFKLVPLIMVGLKMAAMAGFYMIAIGILAFIAIILIAAAPSIYKYLMFRYQLLITAAYRSIWEEKPEEVYEYATKEIAKRREVLSAGQRQVKGVMNNNDSILANFSLDFDQRKAKAERLQQNGDMQGAQAELVRIGKLMEAGKNMAEANQKVKMFYDKYVRGLKALDQVEEDAKLDFQISSGNYQAGKSLSKSWGMMKQAFKGQAFEDDLRSNSLQFMKQDFQRKMANVDVWSEECETTIKHIEDKNLDYADGALAMLNKVNSMDFGSIIKKPEQIQFSSAQVLDVTPVSTSTRPYSEMINKK